MNRRFRPLFGALLVALMLTTGLVASAAPELQRDIFGWIVARRLTVQNAASFQSSVDVDGAATFAADVTQSNGNLTIADFARISPQAAISVTMNGVITPAGSYQPLESAGTVATSNLVTSTMSQGDLLLLINTAATTITISDTADLLLGGNRALGQNDTLLLLHDGDDWVELSTTNN